MANVVEYKLNNKKEKILSDIFKSDYQGILDDKKTKKKTFDERLRDFLKEITQ